MQFSSESNSPENRFHLSKNETRLDQGMTKTNDIQTQCVYM